MKYIKQVIRALAVVLAAGYLTWSVYRITLNTTCLLYTSRSKCNGLYLDVNCASTANGTNIQVYTGNRSAAQQFYLQKVGDLVPEGVYTIVSALDSNKVVDINCASAENGANVQLYTANGTTAQKFRFEMCIRDRYSSLYTAMCRICSAIST